MVATFWTRAALLGAYIAMGVCSIAAAQEGDSADKLQSSVTAPPNMARLDRTLGGAYFAPLDRALGGAYFVDKELLERYEACKARLAQVRDDIARGDATSDAAMQSLDAIRREAEALRKELEAKKVFVAAYQVYSQTSESTFPLGDERLVIITGDHVIVRGWAGPGIKCVLEKTIVAKAPPAASDFDAINVRHELTVASDMVGLTKAERDQKEREFADSEAGRKLTPEGRANRRKIVEEIHHSFDRYQAFQGRRANVIQLTGLDHQEGNRNLVLRIASPKGGTTMSSQWQRHAELTVYVPPCQALAARGCQVGLDVRDLEGDLLLTTHGSRNRDYEGSFAVDGVKGNVAIDQVPVRALSNVTGDVDYVATDEFVNSGTRHANDMRTFSTYPTHETRIERIDGDLRAEFLRTELTLSEIHGAIDVVNRFGATRLTLSAVAADGPRRIVSDSGAIAVSGEAGVLKETPIYAYTQCGRLETNVAQEVLESIDFSTGQPRMGWHGFVPPSQERFDMSRFERPAAALENRERSAGLDLISPSGMVSILATEPPATP